MRAYHNNAYYQDKYGDIWVWVGRGIIKRLKDGNLGSFQDGRDLIKVPAPKESV